MTPTRYMSWKVVLYSWLDEPPLDHVQHSRLEKSSSHWGQLGEEKKHIFHHHLCSSFNENQSNTYYSSIRANLVTGSSSLDTDWWLPWMSLSSCTLTVWSITSVQTELSEQISDRLPWNVIVPWGWTQLTLVMSLLFLQCHQEVKLITYSVKYLNIYYMDSKCL